MIYGAALFTHSETLGSTDYQPKITGMIAGISTFPPYVNEVIVGNFNDALLLLFSHYNWTISIV
jgi:hypothetical protein